MDLPLFVRAFSSRLLRMTEPVHHHQQQSRDRGREFAHCQPQTRPAFRPDQKLSHDDINRLEIAAYSGPIHVVTSRPQMLAAVAELRRENLLGFDIETRPSFKKGDFYPPALLQLAGAEAVFIFQLAAIGGLPAELAGLLADPGITKAGVAIDRDIRELRSLTEFQPAGFVDLGALAARRGVKHHGLRGLAAVLLGCRISKGGRLTRWDRPNLPQKALLYAATDAWIGRRIFEALRKLDRPGTAPATATVGDLPRRSIPPRKAGGGTPMSTSRQEASS
jgi:hypothetical protein